MNCYVNEKGFHVLHEDNTQTTYKSRAYYDSIVLKNNNIKHYVDSMFESYNPSVIYFIIKYIAKPLIILIGAFMKTKKTKKTKKC